MLLMLASMPVLNLLTKYISTPKTCYKPFPRPPLLAVLSFLHAEIASVFFTAQEMPDWQYEKGLLFSLMSIVLSSTVTCLWAGCGIWVHGMLLLSACMVSTCKASYFSNPTAKGNSDKIK